MAQEDELESLKAAEETTSVHPLAAEVAHALRGALFPTDRTALVHVARENEAPRTLLTLLSGLPDRRFAHAAEVVHALEMRSLPGPHGGPHDRRGSLPEGEGI